MVRLSGLCSAADGFFLMLKCRLHNLGDDAVQSIRRHGGRRKHVHQIHSHRHADGEIMLDFLYQTSIISAVSGSLL